MARRRRLRPAFVVTLSFAAVGCGSDGGSPASAPEAGVGGGGGVGGVAGSGGNAGNGGACPVGEPTSWTPCDGEGLHCQYSIRGCNEAYLCKSRLWRTDPTIAGGCCPPTLPQDAMPCPGEGATCTYDDGRATCTSGAWVTEACPAMPLMSDPCTGDLVCNTPSNGCITDYLVRCEQGRWGPVQMVSLGACNPPPPCPTTEPSEGSVCGNPASTLSYGCRYAREGCFVYVGCSPSANGARFVSIGGPADGCCPSSAPTPGDACDRAGLSCAYQTGTAVVCSNGAWSPKPSGAGGAGGVGGSAGAGGFGG